MISSSPSQERPKKRERAHVGTTNRKPDRSTNSRSPRPPQRPSLSPPREGVMKATTASTKKQRETKESREAKEKKEMEKTNLEVMRCKFVECFEEGKNNLQVGRKHGSRMPPTRFSCSPSHRNTFPLTTGTTLLPPTVSVFFVKTLFRTNFFKECS